MNLSFKFSKKFNLPPKSEKFIPNHAIKLNTSSIRTLITLIGALSLFPQLVTTILLINGFSSSPATLYTLGIEAIVAFPILLAILKRKLSRTKGLAILLWGLMGIIGGLFHAAGLGRGYTYPFVYLFVGDLAGNLALLILSLRKKVLTSKVLLAHTFVLYALIYWILTRFVDFQIWQLWGIHAFSLMIAGGIFYGLCSAKEVTVLDERLKEVGRPIELGEAFYYGAMLRYEGLARQLLLIYSKLAE